MLWVRRPLLVPRTVASTHGDGSDGDDVAAPVTR
jgi:hypothetical protein